ncbi:hypothetical protein WKW80_10820 [Variovorax humicola]|uniref:Uncharacterized protein n=1 Tax=Variovorax humicola TaxID=1769758 RepID=A0ABU8VXW2_9BURK
MAHHAVIRNVSRVPAIRGTEQKAVVRVVGNLALFNGAVIILLISFAEHLAMPFVRIAPLALVAIPASIPLALPSMFTLAATVGARAVREAASCQCAFQRSMKQPGWMSCASTRPEH